MTDSKILIGNRVMRKCVAAAIMLAAIMTTIVAAEESTLLKPGIEAPPFSLPSLDGDRVALRTWSGEPLNKPHVNNVKHTVIVNFWATYCKPCQKEIPQLISFLDKNKDKPVKVFCITIDKEGAGVVAPFIKEKKYSVPILLDPYAKTAERYGVKSLPALFVIGPEGTIRYSGSGYDDNVDLVKKMQEIFDGIESGRKPEAGPVVLAGESVPVLAAAPKADAAPEPAAAPKTAPAPKTDAGEDHKKTMAREAGSDSSVLVPGALAPPFSLPELTGGRAMLRMWCGDSLAKPHVNDKKHIVILNFWATYCKPCQKEIPELMSFMAKNKDKPIKTFCISIDKEGASQVGPFINEKKYTLPILLDPFARTAQRYGVGNVPALFVIDPEGIIRYSAMGYDEQTGLEKKLQKIVSEILEGKTTTSVGVDRIGASVDVRDAPVVAVNTGTTDSGQFSPRERWDAIVRVECGDDLNDVAADLGVSPDELKEWYKQLKKTVLQMWRTVADSGSLKK